MKRYALVGTGHRGFGLYGKALVEHFSDCVELSALCDPNRKRALYVQSKLGDMPVFTDFDEMIQSVPLDGIVLTTVDAYHDEYAVRALAAGLDVLCEKPMAIDAAKCRAILEAEQRYGRRIRVTFNCRFMPHIEQLKRIVKSGVLGDILNVDFEWMLDTSHGADYFRRWHCHMEKSGGLLVHKATHHFDIINFLIDQEPISVYAQGSLRFYGGDRRPHGVNCRACETPCPYAFPECDHPDMKGLYFDAEDQDGYLRDRCIFDPSIDIYDTMNLAVRYHGGAGMSYSLIAHAPYEGWRLSISGTGGRLESSEGGPNTDPDDPCFHTRVFLRDGQTLSYDIRRQEGLHGGSDLRMLDRLLRHPQDDPLGQCAGSREGALSILVGIAANESIRRGAPVRLSDLVNLSDYESGPLR
ncbi:MAG TPA: Gfo/Idh/MocA family oxidoreductase [Clostridia bacterium]|nr:Gfo/Idh/MocA family oxidoreductase [Clostridia bacterium]